MTMLNISEYRALPTFCTRVFGDIQAIFNDYAGYRTKSYSVSSSGKCTLNKAAMRLDTLVVCQ